jgi:hypothetical protein
LESHLNDDQIDGLLRLDRSENEESTFDRKAQEIALTHLNACEICHARVREQERAMERLALLKPNAPGAPSPQCPPDIVWIEVAAGITTENSDNYVNHAVQCDHCGPLLREAIADFAEELTPEEEARIANLSSSAAGWQTKIAARLCGAQVSPQIAFFPTLPSWLATLLAPSRLALAGALIGLVVLGVRDYRRTAYLSAQNLQATADIDHLMQDVVQQRTNIAELTAELNRTDTSATLSAPQRKGDAQIAALVLDPGLTRGIGGLKHLEVPPGAEIVKITLHLVGTPASVVREDLLTVYGQKIWTQELRPSDSEKTSKSLTLLVPGYLLTPDNYQIVLSHELSGGFEQVATYTFRVDR